MKSDRFFTGKKAQETFRRFFHGIRNEAILNLFKCGADWFRQINTGAVTICYFYLN